MWVSLQVADALVGILCVYAPTIASERAWFWGQIVDVLPIVDSWIVGGDFNNVETGVPILLQPSPRLLVVKGMLWTIFSLL